MDRWRISEGDVRVRADRACHNVSIFGVDPVGINVGASVTVAIGAKYDDEDDFIFSLDESVVSSIVAWAYNLGYENGKEK